MLVAIDPDYSIHQLIQMLQLKLIWKGYLTNENKALFINIGDIQMTTSLGNRGYTQIKGLGYYTRTIKSQMDGLSSIYQL